jgi:hypothetical protein
VLLNAVLDVIPVFMKKRTEIAVSPKEYTLRKKIGLVDFFFFQKKKQKAFVLLNSQKISAKNHKDWGLVQRSTNFRAPGLRTGSIVFFLSKRSKMCCSAKEKTYSNRIQHNVTGQFCILTAYIYICMHA